MSSTCHYWRPRCKRPCGAQSSSWFPGLCAMHAHHVMLDVDPEEGELLHKAYLLSKRCKHELPKHLCATCLGIPTQDYEVAV